jgi:hypothetical protein
MPHQMSVAGFHGDFSFRNAEFYTAFGLSCARLITPAAVIATSRLPKIFFSRDTN